MGRKSTRRANRRSPHSGLQHRRRRRYAHPSLRRCCTRGRGRVELADRPSHAGKPRRVAVPGTPSSRTLTTTTRSRPKLNIATAFPVSAAPVYQCWASSICGNSARVASNMPRLTIAGRRRCVVPQRWFRRRVALDTSSGPTRPSSCRPRSDRKGRSNSAGLAILSLVESVPPKRLQSITPALPGIESEECMFDIIGRHPRSPRGVGHELDDVHVRGSRDEGTRVGRIAQPAFHLPQCTRRSGRNPVDWPCLKTSERTIYVVLCLVELGGIEPPSISP